MSFIAILMPHNKYTKTATKKPVTNDFFLAFSMLLLLHNYKMKIL